MSTQGDNLKAIAYAIRAKEGSSDPIVASDFPARIAAIETGTQLPTLADPGTASDMASGKQLIDQNGQIVTGNVSTIESGYTGSLPGTSAYLSTGSYGNTIYITGTMPSTYGTLFRNGAGFTAGLAAENFGNATAADVATGKTFTSETGVKMTGTGQFLKFGLYQYTGYGSANTGIPSYPTSSYPVAIFITMNDTIPYADNTVFQLSVVGLTGCISGANFVRSDEVSRGTYASDKISLVLDSASNELLIYTPNASGGGFITFESGKPYSIYYFYS